MTRRRRQISLALRIAGPAALRKWNRGRHHRAKCGALARSTGQPCRQLALANGRCFYHGGRTPKDTLKSKKWHVAQYADGVRPDGHTKLNRKLRDQERAARKREARLAAMTPEERAAHVEWHRTHKPGVNRAALREELRQNREAVAVMAAGSERPPDPELQAITARLEQSRARLATLEAAAAMRAAIEAGEGVFG